MSVFVGSALGSAKTFSLWTVRAIENTAKLLLGQPRAAMQAAHLVTLCHWRQRRNAHRAGDLPPDPADRHGRPCRTRMDDLQS